MRYKITGTHGQNDKLVTCFVNAASEQEAANLALRNGVTVQKIVAVAGGNDTGEPFSPLAKNAIRVGTVLANIVVAGVVTEATAEQLGAIGGILLWSPSLLVFLVWNKTRIY